MFPRLNNGPASHLYILRPGYDPLIESYACGAGAPVSGRTSFRPDRDVRGDRANSRMAPCCRSDQRPVPCGAGSRGDRRAEAPRKRSAQGWRQLHGGGKHS